MEKKHIPLAVAGAAALAVVTLAGTFVLTMKGHTVCVIDRAHVEVPA